MKILVFGDIQVYPYSEFSSESGGSTRLLDMCRSTFEWISALAEDDTISEVVCLGDVFDRANPIDVRSLKIVAQGMSWLEKHHIRRVRVLVGNHDLFSTQDTHTLSSLPQRVYEVPRIEGEFAYLPYVKDIPALQRYVDSSDWSDVHTIFSHNPILEYEYKSGSGRAKDEVGIDFSSLKDRVVIHGHYHEPDQFELNGVHHIVCGAPSGRSFSDGHDLGSTYPFRGALIYDTDKPSLRRILNPHAWYFETWRGADPESLDRALQSRLGSAGSPRPDQLFLRITTDSPDSVEGLRSVLERREVGGYRILVDQEALSPSGAYQPPSIQTDPSASLQEYVKTISLPPEYDASRVIETGRRYLAS